MYQPVPFDETYVLYDSNSPVALAMVIFTLLPIAILVFYGSWFVTSREIEPVIMLGGQVVNNMVVKFLKRIFKHQRPVGLYENINYPVLQNDYAMPSAHSQFMGYFVTYSILHFLLHPSGRHYDPRLKFLISLGLISAAALTGFSRVYLLYHITEQVLAGILGGSIVGVCYFVISTFLRDIGLVDWGLNLWFVKCFCIKDSWDCSLSYQEDYDLYKKQKEKSIAKKEN